MITSIEGTLSSAGPLRAVIELGGIGYEVNIPVTTAERLPQAGSKVKLHTLVIYREDAQTLYGFASAADRDFFRLMIENVTGIGPKVALSIMSRLSLPLLEGAIRAGDVTTLAKCPGIGRKTAERLVVELKARVGSPGSYASAGLPDGSAGGGENSHRDAVAALVALGYKSADADQAVRRAALALGPKRDHRGADQKSAELSHFPAIAGRSGNDTRISAETETTPVPSGSARIARDGSRDCRRRNTGTLKTGRVGYRCMLDRRNLHPIHPRKQGFARHGKQRACLPGIFAGEGESRQGNPPPDGNWGGWRRGRVYVAVDGRQGRRPVAGAHPAQAARKPPAQGLARPDESGRTTIIATQAAASMPPA